MTWEELRAEVIALTSRETLVTQTDIAIRNAIRTAHKSAKYWRDLVEVPVVGLSTSDPVQEIDLASKAPKFRQAVILAEYDNPTKHYRPVGIDELIATDGYNTVQTDVYWGFGTKIRIRSATPVENYLLTYYKYPTASPTEGTDSWIVEEHSDLITLWAAMTILQYVGENEIRSRLEQLASLAFADLQQDNLEVQGR